MNNQLKLLLYIVFVAAIFIVVQNKFNIFDVKLNTVNQNQSKISEEVKSSEASVPNTPYVEIYNEDHKVIRVAVELAETKNDIQMGLSGRSVLGDYNGMLFIMEKQDTYPFWMKDMQFPLDMIFIDSQGFIVDIKKNEQPCNADYCPNIYANSVFKYVLEVNAGFSDLNRVGIGNSIVLNLGGN